MAKHIVPAQQGQLVFLICYDPETDSVWWQESPVIAWEINPEQESIRPIGVDYPMVGEDGPDHNFMWAAVSSDGAAHASLMGFKPSIEAMAQDFADILRRLQQRPKG
jgi:hypothetical protein